LYSLPVVVIVPDSGNQLCAQNGIPGSLPQTAQVSSIIMERSLDDYYM